MKRLDYIKSKGFNIDDKKHVLEYLDKVCLYKLSKYFKNFNKQKNIDFKEVINHYLFDQELRNINFKILEDIENSFKSQFILNIGDNYNNLDFYIDKQKNEKILFIKEKLEYFFKNDPDFKNYNNDYKIFINKLTFGELFKLFKSLEKQHKYKIVNFYGIKNIKIFENWIFCLKYLRNLSSHGDNVFNRKMNETIKGKKLLEIFNIDRNNVFISYFGILSIFNKILGTNENYYKEIFYNLDKYNIDYGLFGQKKYLPQCASERGMEGHVNILYDFYIKKSKENFENIVNGKVGRKTMKILTLGLGAFGFAINKLLGENNPSKTFYAFELNKDIVTKLKKDREHPFFFPGYKLPNNIEIVHNYDHIIGEADLLILAIPAQFIGISIEGLKDKIKDGVTIMNLAKGIDIKSNKPISEVLSEGLKGKKYNYAVLSGGMIASELVEGKILGADLGIKSYSPCHNPLSQSPHSNPLPKGEGIRDLLENENFNIKLREDVLNIELYGSLKNIAAILVGYYEGKGLNKSSIGYYLVGFYDEMKEIIDLYGGNKNIDFGYYSLGGDLVTSCFGNTRNRYFGQLLGEGKSIDEVLKILKDENKHAEGYETLKAVYGMVKGIEGFENVKFLFSLIK